MKYVNPGTGALLDIVEGFQQLDNPNFSNTGLLFINPYSALSNTSPFRTDYPLGSGATGSWQKNFEGTTEVWASFDVCLYAQGGSSMIPAPLGRWGMQFLGSAPLPVVHMVGGDATPTPLFKVYSDSKGSTVLYDPKKAIRLADKNIHNIELHMKTGENGRIDMWIDTKLFFSYRSPTDFNGEITGFKVSHTQGSFCPAVAYSSIIIQDTRRIGLEKFKKLTIDPATEQNMAQGSMTGYTLSGLMDAAEYTDITGVVALLQPTSRDANITTGTFTLNGAEVGTVDVSSSSGTDYVEAVSTVNSLTTKPWTRDDIEGKTLTLKVDGAS